MLILSSVAVLWFAACGDEHTTKPEGSGWIVIDTVHAPVDSIRLPLACRAQRALSVVFVVEDDWEGMYDALIMRFSHVEIERTAGTITYEIWGDICEWEGNYPMPPCGGCGFTYEHVEPPPFCFPELVVRVRQPGDAILETTVTIVP